MQLCSWGSVKLVFRPGCKTKQSPSLLQLIVCVVEMCRVLLEVLRATQSAHTPLLEVQSPQAISLIGLYHLTFWEWRANIVSWMLDATSKFWGTLAILPLSVLLVLHSKANRRASRPINQ